MKEKLSILILMLFVNFIAKPQTVVVNADGTHSIAIDNGSTSLIVNPDGSHTTVINNGNSSLIVNPNGMHSTVINNGSTSTTVNPDGTHSTNINIEVSKTVVNTDGSHKTLKTKKKNSSSIGRSDSIKIKKKYDRILGDKF